MEYTKNLLQNINQNINWNYVIYAIIALVILMVLCAYMYNGQNNQPAEQKAEAENIEKFDKNATQNGIKGEIVLYYASWCGHSKTFLPEWEKFEQYARANLPQVKVTKIRCEGGNEAICNQKGIPVYPTVILYPINNTEIAFEGNRTSDALAEFINKNL